MKKLTKQEYQVLREGATVIEADPFGEKVLLLSDGTYLKLFRARHLFSLARIYPYSKRFVRNAQKLAEKGIPTVTVIELFRISCIHRTAVHYSPLTGKTLKKLADKIDLIIINKLGRFIRELHEKGIHFRSLHMGNIVVTPENRLGLIDVADMKIYSKPLDREFRLRNFQHTARYPEDMAAIMRFLPGFIQGYQAREGSPFTTDELQDLLTTIYTKQK
ncbi:hypothetical protein [uncultured Porticoccus sp.]|uniref:hypothetical protein n=1 Tax=uncultured Porticoccus sp. TaxID=1256050 RepID=UPI0026319A1E|nr:hypothetical protein [uncultured Porticoccus sp.]